MNPGTASNSTSNTQIREHKRTILASEIAGLPDLYGYLKLPGAPIGTIQLQYEPHPEVSPRLPGKRHSVAEAEPRAKPNHKLKPQPEPEQKPSQTQHHTKTQTQIKN